MKIHLINENRRCEMNLDFTKFFSTKGEKVNGVIVSYDHRAMIRAIVETFEKGESYIEDLFKQALREDISDEARAILEKNYTLFKTMYKKEDSLIKKMNDFKIKGLYHRLILNNRSFLVSGHLFVIYNKTEGLKETNYEEGFIKTVNRIYEPIIDKSIFVSKVSISKLKKATLLGHIQVNNNFYDFKKIFKYLNSKEEIEVRQFNDFLFIKQSDREVLLTYYKCELDEDEITVKLEDIA